MKKKLFIIIGIALPIFIMLYFWYADCWTTMRINWKISMPYMSLYREIYHKDSEPSFFGDGTRYHVYSYKNEKHIEKMVEWQTEEKETEIRSSYSEFIREELDRIDVVGIIVEEHPNNDNLTATLQIKKTDKLGLDQTQEPICKTSK